LHRQFKGDIFFVLLNRIIDSYNDGEGRGLPIGSLTSQYFANFYLQKVDHCMLEDPLVQGYVRYMDDMVWFCETKQAAQITLKNITDKIEYLQLRIKPHVKIQPCAQGVHYCGYRILPYQLFMSRRKKRRMKKLYLKVQQEWCQGLISDDILQQQMDVILNLGHPAPSLGFRQKLLSSFSAIDV